MSPSCSTTLAAGSHRHLVAVPYPGRGHINPMLNLCRRILSSPPSNDGHQLQLTISFVVTEEWLSLLFLSPTPTTTDLPPNLRFLTLPNVIPSEHGRAADFAGFLEAVGTRMEEPFERLIEGLDQSPPDAIIADTYLVWAVAVGNRRNIPVCSLWTMSASFFSALYHLNRIPASTLDLVIAGEADESLSKYIPVHNSMMVSDLHGILTSVSSATRDRALEAVSMVKNAQCVLFTSFCKLEAQVIDALRRDLHCPVYPVGPSIPYMMLNDKQPTDNSIEWLNKQPKQTVLYVSLGSFLSVSAIQMDEIAMGLRLSGVRFLWVARGDSSRLQEMVGGDVGLVVPWCDQLRVLSHPSVGGFLTHCGWNSTLEAAFCGVPMLTFPIFWDQLVDSRLIVDDWKVGLSLRGEVGRDCIVGREGIALVVKKLMDLDGVASKEMRVRAVALSDAAHAAIEAGGSTFQNLDSFVASIAGP